jgi:hypothetical protein
VVNKRKKSRLNLSAGIALVSLLACEVQSASAQNDHKRIADANALVTSESLIETKPALSAHKPTPGSLKGPYYVDFRARTAASWGHAFVWYGKTSERAVEVAGLTPAGDTLSYMLGYVTWVPSETGASYGDLDPEYLTASYRVYLDEADAQRVFAHIKKLQASSKVWSAEVSNCNNFIGEIADYMGLKTPSRWERPEEYVTDLRKMNGGVQMVHLSSEQ